MKKLTAIIAIVCLSCISLFAATKIDNMKETSNKENDKLVIVWSTQDPMVAERMILMYSTAAKQLGWWKEVTIIVWGPSAKLIAENEKIQKQLSSMLKLGIKIEVCKACSDMYGVSDTHVKLGHDVKFMGKYLTEYLKSDAKVITF